MALSGRASDAFECPLLREDRKTIALSFSGFDPNRTFRFLSGGLTQRVVSVSLATFAAGRASRFYGEK
jgi:hypothetical protein